MSDTEQIEWDRRYAEGEYRPRTAPSPLLESWLGRLPRGAALDVACGTGRNALCLAAAGFAVQAVDISEVALDAARAESLRRGLTVDWVRADLDAWFPAPASADLITVIRYTNRALWPRLQDALRPDGWLLVEHHLVTHRPVGGPPTDCFRLVPQELLRAFSGLRIVHYAERLETSPDGPVALVTLAACNGDPGF